MKTDTTGRGVEALPVARSERSERARLVSGSNLGESVPALSNLSERSDGSNTRIQGRIRAFQHVQSRSYGDAQLADILSKRAEEVTIDVVDAGRNEVALRFDECSAGGGGDLTQVH
jgi:hypothetical protein